VSGLCVLSRRALNRATLARQLLLERASIGAERALEQLAGLQAQLAMPPYIGLWTRLAGFQREELDRLIADRRVVRAPLMRHTLHLMTADDYVRLRTAIQPALTRSWRGWTGKRLKGLDIEPVLAAAREHLSGAQRSHAELQAHVAPLEPDRDPSALGLTVRTHVPLVQVPSNGRWAYGATAPYALAAEWLGRPLDPGDQVSDLVRRYLAAFGPASVRDAQVWSGRSGLKPVLEEMRPELVTFRDEAGVELFDLPEAPRPPADTPAPPRLLPEYDNLVLSHADRTRVLAEEHRPLVSLPAGRVRSTFLFDGFVAGTWKLDKRSGAVELEPFGRLGKRERAALETEAERLAGFVR
jgi:hypothetical protein